MNENNLDVESLFVSAPPSPAQARARKIAGALAAAAVADAMGWMTEFARSKDHVQSLYGVDQVADFRSWKKKCGGRFNTYIDYINPGEYSDDTQLTLCTARAIRTRTVFDAEYFSKVEMPLWLDYARGAGATITAAAKALRRPKNTWFSNFFTFKRGKRTLDYRDAGANGAAMRIAPIALAMAEEPDSLWLSVFQNTIATHGHPRAVMGALVHATALAHLLLSTDPDFVDFLDTIAHRVESVRTPSHAPEIRAWVAKWNSAQNRNWESEFDVVRQEVLTVLPTIKKIRSGEVGVHSFLESTGCFHPATKGSGTGTALAALAYFIRFGANLQKLVVHAVNEIGTDTDTIAAMAAGLAGAVQGIESLPELWFNRMQDFPYITRVADALSEMSLGSSHYPSLAYHGNGLGTLPDIRDLVTQHRAIKNQRVRHPIFGPGIVSSVDVQQIRRRGGGEMMLAVVGFDMGQTCKFRAYAGPAATRREAPRNRKES